MTNLFQRSLRRLRRSPGFTVAAVSSLALGIGATTAMFTLMESLLLRPLPVHQAQRLVRINGLDAEGRLAGVTGSMRGLLLREDLFDGVCGFLTSSPTVQLRGDILSGSTLAVTGECLDTLGVQAAVGRVLGPTDDAPGAPRVAMLTYDAWQTHWEGDVGVLGQNITIEGHRATIVGVAQRGFSGFLLGFPSRVIYPVDSVAQFMDAFSPGWSVSRPTDLLARLKQNDSIESLTARLRISWPRLLEASVPIGSSVAERDAYLRQRPSVTSASTGIDYMLRERFERPVVVLVGVALLVFIIACVNVANLQVARSLVMRRELSVHLALGASRWRLVRDALAESLLLLLTAMGLGIAIAYAANRILVSLFGARFSGFALDVTPDARTLWFTCATGALSFAIFALGPAWSQYRVDSRTLLDGSSSPRVTGRGLLRRALVVIQVTMTLALLAGALLFATTLERLRRIPTGFDAESVLSMYLQPLPGGYQNGFSVGVYYRALIERLTQLPGVSAVSLTQLRPLSDSSRLDLVGVVEAPESNVRAERAVVADGFLRAMGIPLISGTDLRGAISAGERTVVVSQSLAHRLFGDRVPLGELIHIGGDTGNGSARVIGVARDAILTNPQARNTLVVYESFWDVRESLQRNPTLLVKFDGEPARIASIVRHELQGAGREYFRRVRTPREERDASLAQERLLASLSLSWAAVGLALAGIGIYGLLNFSVLSRKREIGIRIAIGAQRNQVIFAVVREAVALIVVGVLIGLPFIWVFTKAVQSLLQGVGPLDSGIFGAAVGVLLIVGGLAAWTPARRAASVAPCEVLRHDS